MSENPATRICFDYILINFNQVLLIHERFFLSRTSLTTEKGKDELNWK